EALDTAVLADLVEETREVGQVAVLERRVARVTDDAAEDFAVAHALDHGAIAAARLAGDGAVAPVGQGAERLVDPGNQLVDEIGLVAPGGARVEVLASAPAREAIGEGGDQGPQAALADQTVETAVEPLVPAAGLEQHDAASRVPGQNVDHGEAPLGGGQGIVARRQVHVDVALHGIAERVAGESAASQAVAHHDAALVGHAVGHDAVRWDLCGHPPSLRSENAKRPAPSTAGPEAVSFFVVPYPSAARCASGFPSSMRRAEGSLPYATCRSRHLGRGRRP